MNNYNLGCYSFLAGSLLFTIDHLKHRPINKTTLSACLLFDLGCYYFIKDSNHDY